MPNTTPNLKPAGGLTLLTAVAAIALRLVRFWNIGGLGALGLYAGGRLRWWMAWLPSMAILALSDLILNNWFSTPPSNRWVYASLLVYVLLGRLLVGSRSPWRIGAVTVLGSLQFYLITNFGVWCNSLGLPTPMYPPTWAGLVECYTLGLPFLKYTLLGDLGITAAVFAAEAWLTQPIAEPAAEEVRA